MHSSHTQGILTFEGDASFSRNRAALEDNDEFTRGGAISNTGSGSIFFKGSLTMEDNAIDVGVGVSKIPHLKDELVASCQSVKLRVAACLSLCDQWRSRC